MHHPIHVLCVMSTLDRGGSESMVMNLFRYIDRTKIMFDFVKHTSKTGAYEEEILNLGGRIFEAPRYNLYNHIQYVSWWKRFLLQHPEYLIIHGHFFTISGVYFAVAKSCGRITVGHSHSTETVSDWKRRPVHHIVSNYYVSQIEKYSDYALACSNKAGNWLFKNKKFVVLNNAIDCERFRFNENKRNEYRRMFDLGDEIVVGTVANISNVKNPMGLLDIFIALKALKPKSKLIWVGGGDGKAEVENRIKKENIEELVIMLGRRDDVADILQAMDAFLLPSYNEGLPVSVIEAQGAGLPCYISNRVTNEVDITGLCHFLPIEQPDNWAEKWAKIILNDRTCRKDMSALIRESGYDIQTTSKWLEDFYLSIYPSE